MNGIQTGSPVLQKTVLPVEAIANVSIRLAPGQKVEEIAPEVERILREAAPAGADLEVECGRRRRRGSCRRMRRRCSSGSTRSSSALGRRPALIRSGGTLPIVPALTDKGIPTVITGFGLPDSQVHSPNERLVADYVTLGIAPRASSSSRSRLFDRSPLSRPAGPRRRGRDARRGTRALRCGGRRRRRGARRERRTFDTTTRPLRSRWRRRFAALQAASPPVRLVAGGELDLAELDRPKEELARFGLGGTRWLLVETPYWGWPLDIAERLFRLRVHGFGVVLAHPERNADVQERPELLEPLVAGGTLVQLTAASVDGRLGPTRRTIFASAARAPARAPHRERRSCAGHPRSRPRVPRSPRCATTSSRAG